MITGGDLRQSRLDVGYKTFTISPCYIATPKHLPHWKVIKQKCEHQLAVFEKFSDEMQSRFASFKGALLDNLYAANSIIQQLEVTIKEA